MKIRYTKHALERMFSRDISKNDIREALRRGQKNHAESFMTKCAYQSLKGNLVVIYNARTIAEIIIITAYRQ